MISFCKNCCNQRLAERSDSEVTDARWKAMMIGREGSRGKLSASFAADGFVNKTWERYAATKLWAKDFMSEAVQLEKSSQKESQYKGSSRCGV